MNSLLAQPLAAALERQTPSQFRVLDVLPAKYGFLFSIHAKQRRATVLEVKGKYHTANSLQGVSFAIIVFKIVRSFRMHAVCATLVGLPAFRSR